MTLSLVDFFCGAGGSSTGAIQVPGIELVAAANETGLALSPPFIAELRGGGSTARPVADPLATVTASGRHHGLVTRHYSTREGESCAHLTTPAERPVGTVKTSGGMSVMTGETLDLDDVRFRMLEPREYSRAMDFPDGYHMAGNRREQVRLAGNAVTPPAARDIVSVVAESLGVA